MKIKFYTLSALCLTLILASCGGGNEKETDEKSNEETCLYAVNQESYELTWTAFKTTGKVPVGGTFDGITISGGSAESPAGALEGVEFEIITNTVNSQNEERDGKIAKHFFETINTMEITGKVASVDSEGGKATVTITMNGISFDVTGDLEMTDENFSWSASIDMINWNGMDGISALNDECFDLHKGADGESKLWPEIAIGFKGSFEKDCE